MKIQTIINTAESIADRSERTIDLKSLALLLDEKGFNWTECSHNQDKWYESLEHLREAGYSLS